ncbi:cytochrome P450 [Bimuria novae-zelandiae CBS 107.79]|uniref:Cytochrome P450 n=1 Tax=Bimuria novae-zelandiae CBS 107.79 TaxID=1447943 RepID=A0A6A5VHA7_9PLEO|nr:cytochrome P450 [Bimuria novae-zelandiae CBS 107.79]
MHLLPPSHQGPWASLTAQRYGELFTLRIASTTWVFLNSSRVVTDLLEKRSAIYSSRPRMPFASECMSGGCRVVVMPYGERWRSVRKIMHGILNGRNAELFRGFQERESERLVGEVLRRPEGWWAANQRYANGVVMGVVFGKGITSEEGAEGLGKEGNGKSIFGPNGEEGANVLKKNGGGKSNIEKLFDTSQEFIAALQPGANLVDVFTFLDRLPTPLKWWIPRGKASFQRLLDVYGAEVRDLNQRVKNGTCPPCFATKFLDDPASEALGETQRLFALGSLMEAGSDTSRMTLSQIIAAAATDARWVRRAQEVMDRVLGVAERLPGLGDRGELRYLSAVVKEGWRWRPFAEIGMFSTCSSARRICCRLMEEFSWTLWNLSGVC